MLVMIGGMILVLPHIFAIIAHFSRIMFEAVNGHEILLGDHHINKVLGTGGVILQFTYGKKVNLINVLHVYSIRKNLVSGFVLCKKGLKTIIESDKIILSKVVPLLEKVMYLMVCSLVEKYARVTVKTTLKAAYFANNPYYTSPSPKRKGYGFDRNPSSGRAAVFN